MVESGNDGCFPPCCGFNTEHTPLIIAESQTIPTMRNLFPTFFVKTSSSLETSLVSCDRVISTVFPGRQHANGSCIHGNFQIPLFNLLDVHNYHLGVHMATSVAMKAVTAPIVSALWHMHRTPMWFGIYKADRGRFRQTHCDVQPCG